MENKFAVCTNIGHELEDRSKNHILLEHLVNSTQQFAYLNAVEKLLNLNMVFSPSAFYISKLMTTAREIIHILTELEQCST